MNPKRAMGLFFCMIFTFVGIVFRLYYLAASPESLQIREAAFRQQQMIIPMSERRGFIYDCLKRPLNYSLTGGAALVQPILAENTTMLKQSLFFNSRLTFPEVNNAVDVGAPFSILLDNSKINGNGIKNVERYVRGFAPIAPHILGYVNADQSSGLMGIEKGYNSYLKETGGKIYAVGQRISSGELLKFGETKIINDGYYEQGGIMLTIDSDIQKIVETVASKLDKGAVVLIENETNKIRAIASAPTFETGRIADYLSSDKGEFVNRALEPYNVGSIFKIVVAAVAIEDSVKTGNYTCTGSVTIVGKNFACHKTDGHGTVDFQNAFLQSCNSYFINLSMRLNFEKILEMSRGLKINSKYPVAMGITKKAGSLPSSTDSANLRAVANTAIGQGDIMATPLDLAMLTAAIANGGKFSPPTIMEGLVNPDGSLVKTLDLGEEPIRIMSERTAQKIAKMMVDTCSSGTGKAAQPNGFAAGGKTASAETGWIIDGVRAVHGIFAGFFPADSKKYSLVVLVENGRQGGASAGPIFKEIAEGVMALQ